MVNSLWGLVVGVDGGCCRGDNSIYKGGRAYVKKYVLPIETIVCVGTQYIKKGIITSL